MRIFHLDWRVNFYIKLLTLSKTKEIITYLWMDKFRKPNGIVTCGDSAATYPTIGGGVQDCTRGCEGVGITRFDPWRGARSFWTARRKRKEISTSFITIKDTSKAFFC